jgi:hypothetical protein
MRLIPSVTACSRRFVLVALVLGVALAGTLFVAAPASAQAPAGRQFNLGAAMVLNYIKADKTADFEMIVGRIKEALNKSAKPERKQQAASWKVFKAAEPGPNGSVLYIFMMDPAVKEVDYTIGAILQEAFPEEVGTLYKTFTDSYLSGQIPVNLALVSNFAQ